MLVIIGRSWLDARNERGARRLDDPNDFVRLEIAAALKRNIPVIPIRVGGVQMPRDEELPDDLKALVMRQAAIVTHDNFPHDMGGLERDIRRIVKRPRPWIVIGSGLGLLTVGLWVAINQLGMYEVGRLAQMPATKESVANTSGTQQANGEDRGAASVNNVNVVPREDATRQRQQVANEAFGHVWAACETNTTEICGTWTRQGNSDAWLASWANGAVATLTITVNGQSVTVERKDTIGVSRGLKATYTGTLTNDGQIESGKVEWCCDGFGTRRGTWRASVTR